MNISCNQIDDLLLAGDAFSMEVAARHAAQCPACAEKLAEWEDLSQTARSLHTSWQSDLLWPRIQRSLADARRGSFRAQWLRFAAAVVITTGIAATAFVVVRESVHEARFDQKILEIGAVDAVDRAQRQHEQAIAQMEKLAEPKLEHSDAPLMVSYREKLMLLDEAIAECQSGIERNRQNAHVRKQLLAIYNEKQRTLQDVLREGNDVSNP